MLKEAKFEELAGKTIENISINTNHRDDGCLVSIKTIDFLNVRDGLGRWMHEDHVYKMIHHQECCEGVYLEDISLNELRDLINKKIVFAEMVSQDVSETEHKIEDYTKWTFYKLTAEDGTHATLRFVGYSNGYYSVDVDFYEEVP